MSLGSEWVIRAADAGDLAAIVALERGIPTAPHWSAAEYARIVDGAGALRCLLVAVVDGVAGFVVARFVVAAAIAGEAELETVAVAERFRGLGIGRSLCVAAMAWARTRQASEMLLEVRAGSAGALRLYTGLGFVEIARRGGYYADPVEDAVLMRCRLRDKADGAGAAGGAAHDI